MNNTKKSTSFFKKNSRYRKYRDLGTSHIEACNVDWPPLGIGLFNMGVLVGMVRSLRLEAKNQSCQLRSLQSLIQLLSCLRSTPCNARASTRSYRKFLFDNQGIATAFGHTQFYTCRIAIH
jgi:hypothetical protein